MCCLSAAFISCSVPLFYFFSPFASNNKNKKIRRDIFFPFIIILLLLQSAPKDPNFKCEINYIISACTHLSLTTTRSIRHSLWKSFFFFFPATRRGWRSDMVISCQIANQRRVISPESSDFSGTWLFFFFFLPKKIFPFSFGSVLILPSHVSVAKL